MRLLSVISWLVWGLLALVILAGVLRQPAAPEAAQPGQPSFRIEAGSGTPLGPAPHFPAVSDSAASPASSTPNTTAHISKNQSATKNPPPATPVVPPPAVVSSAMLDAVNVSLRQSLVNILCTVRSGSSFEPISGSGVIIDTRGVILTNAHVGQFLLLRDYPSTDNIDCVVRTGSPATSHYRAQLLYLPPAWIDANAGQLKNERPTGTGENDYAFLQITSTTDGTPLPTSFPTVSLTTDTPDIANQVVLAAYPAQYLGGSTIQGDLYVSSAVTTVDALYTFGSDGGPVDVFSVGSTVVSQEGSSGGAVGRAQDGALIGVITTESEGTTTAQRDLHAITLSYINRSLASTGQGGIAALLMGDLAQKTAYFNATIAPALTQKLISAITH